jgi:hypothetical protein
MVQKFNKYVAKKRSTRRNKPKHLRHQKVLNKHSNMVNSNNKKRGQG